MTSRYENRSADSGRRLNHPDQMTQTSAGRRLPECARVEAFSDGVFAIAITLLVLNLIEGDVPRGEFAQALKDQWPSYLAYLAAFFAIAAIWINHHDLFTRVRAVDIRVLCLNLILLLVTSLFPWPASVLSSAIRDGDHGDKVAAITLYAGVGFLVPFAWIALYGYLAQHPHLLDDSVNDPAYAWSGVRRSLVSVFVYPLAALLGLVAPLAALVAFAVLPPFFIATLLWPRQLPPE
jgi:uncharacterized membrane protein